MLQEGAISVNGLHLSFYSDDENICMMEGAREDEEMSKNMFNSVRGTSCIVYWLPK